MQNVISGLIHTAIVSSCTSTRMLYSLTVWMRVEQPVRRLSIRWTGKNLLVRVPQNRNSHTLAHTCICSCRHHSPHKHTHNMRISNRCQYSYNSSINHFTIRWQHLTGFALISEIFLHLKTMCIWFYCGRQINTNHKTKTKSLHWTRMEMRRYKNSCASNEIGRVAD